MSDMITVIIMISLCYHYDMISSGSLSLQCDIKQHHRHELCFNLQ